MRGRTLKPTLYSGAAPFLVDQDQVIGFDPKAIGIDVTAKPLPLPEFLGATGNPKTAYELVLTRFVADYPDPVDFVNVLLDGTNVTPRSNQSLVLVDDAVLNGRMEAAARLSGARRSAAFGRLDAEIMRTAAPWAPLYVGNVRELVSARVGCYLYQPAWSGLDLANVCLK